MKKHSVSIPVIDAFVVIGQCSNRLFKKVVRSLSIPMREMLRSKTHRQLLKTQMLQCDISTFFEESSVNGVNGVVFAATVRFGDTSFTMTLVVSSAAIKLPGKVKLRVGQSETWALA